MFKMQALIRQLDYGKIQNVELDLLCELTEKPRSIPARVSAHVVPGITC